MLKDFMWNVFSKTGRLDTYVFYKELEEKSNFLMEQKEVEAEVAISNSSAG